MCPSRRVCFAALEVALSTRCDEKNGPVLYTRCDDKKYAIFLFLWCRENLEISLMPYFLETLHMHGFSLNNTAYAELNFYSSISETVRRTTNISTFCVCSAVTGLFDEKYGVYLFLFCCCCHEILGYQSEFRAAKVFPNKFASLVSSRRSKMHHFVFVRVILGCFFSCCDDKKHAFFCFCSVVK